MIDLNLKVSDVKPATERAAAGDSSDGHNRRLDSVNFLSLIQNFDSFMKAAVGIGKISIVIGLLMFVFYSLRIDHFPSDISLGDGVLFSVIAGCFGLVYIMFIAGLVSIGIVIGGLVIRPGLALIGKVAGKSFRKVIGKLNLAPFSWVAVPYVLLGVIIIYGLSLKQVEVFWNLPLVCVGLYLFYSIYRSAGEEIKQIETASAKLVLDPTARIPGREARDSLKKRQRIAIGAIIALPLLGGGVFGQLLEGTMRLANIRVENCVVYLKEPYSSLVPKSLIVANNKQVPKDYVAFDKSTVLVGGLGKTTIVSFPDGHSGIKLEIPKDQIIIVSKSK
ncbi:hypothetical protein [Andreprevotia chitinilytica]|uniref:hypothetical protein n=1 Tax=Andreprevotia chitinilytica TaxID=396808 RepID=UPI0005504F4C|nr:hypothetical protein [Andreprevotia chitinilytica]